jgi:hypothetical protein
MNAKDRIFFILQKGILDSKPECGVIKHKKIASANFKLKFTKAIFLDISPECSG